MPQPHPSVCTSRLSLFVFHLDGVFVVRQRQCTCPENTDLAEAFDELAGLYFKEQSKAGFVYKKARLLLYTLPPRGVGLFILARSVSEINSAEKVGVLLPRNGFCFQKRATAEAEV